MLLDGMTIDYLRNANNQRAAKSSKIETDGTTHYRYGTPGELRGAVVPDGTTIEYVHNANNQRIAVLLERPDDIAT